MTASNAFARSDGAWLFYDTATYDDDGFIRKLGTKVVSNDRMRLAIGFCGRVPRDMQEEASAWLDAQPSQADANKPGIRLLVAWWDIKGHCAVISNDDELGSDFPPFVLHTVRNVTSPAPEFGQWFDFDDDLGAGYDFVPIRDGAMLGELERRQPNDSGGYRVGGSFERIHVHADGIDRATVVQWHDRIGRPIRIGA
jgi:hypothetical protein